MNPNKPNLVVSDGFIRRLKRLKKKYRRIESDVDSLVEIIENGEIPGDKMQGTGEYIVYKTRLASQDLQRGKSGGFRVIYYLRTATYILLLTIYIKTEQEDISAQEILALIQEEEQRFAEEQNDENDEA